MTDTMKNYPELRADILKHMSKLSSAAPDTMKAFSSLHASATAAGALDAKTKELIALSIAVAAKCDGCVAFHTHDALRAGASPEEIIETLGVAVLMGGGPAMVYATHAIDALEQFSKNPSTAVAAG